MKARQTVGQLVLCVSLFLCSVDASGWHPCDNGKLWLQKDLPPSAVYRCAGTSRSESIQKLPSIDTKHPLQPAMSVCMHTPITYNLTVPSSGAHRPVGAESGEYLYCPPQRWLHNLQHGAAVFLYHPCAPLPERVRLSVLAHSCLTHYIITPHFELGVNRPFAVVSWGRSLELSHVTESEACSWLEANAGDSFESRELRKQNEQKYNLYLTQPAGGLQLSDIGKTGAQKLQQSLKHCCEETLSRLREGDAEMDRWMKKRRRRAIFSERRRGKREETYKDRMNNDVVTDPLVHHMGPGQAQDRPVHRPGRDMETRAKMSEAVTGKGGVGKENNTELKHRAFGVVQKLLEDELGGQQKEERESQKTRNRQRGSHTPGAVEGTEERAKLSGGRRENQEKREASREQRYGGDANAVSEVHRGNGRPRSKQPAQNPQDQPHSGKTSHRGGPGCCECTDAPAERAVLGQRQPTRRTDEAVWAAAALGFLLVLLALSVLHTRLYRHWRTMPSLYWHHPRDDYDSVADVVRRRLKMSSRKKRRAPQSRRRESELLPSSSTEEEPE